MLFEAEGNLAKAKEQYEAVLRIDPSAAVASNNLAYLYAQEDTNLDVALSLAQNAKAKLPDAPEVSDTLGWVYLKKGLASLAVPQLEDAATKLPKNGVVHYHLGVALAKVGDVARSKKSLELALTLPIDSATAAEARKLAESL
jgi:tetratricopeptide (TPR) repeat protein